MCKKACITFFLIGMLCGAARVQALETLIGQPLERPLLGSRIVFPIYFYNTQDHPAEVEIPTVLACRLADQQNVVAVTAERIDPVDTGIERLSANEFIKTLYALVLPASLTGAVRLSIPDLGGEVLFMVQITPPSFLEQPTAESAVMPPQEKQKLDLSVFINVYQPYARNISFYQPMYFLYGVDPEESKFQISLKYRFFNPDKPFAQKHPWLGNFFFGYTQTSFWDLSASSRPFEDTSYKPELFFLSPNIDTGWSWIKGFFVQTGFEHESNGGAGDTSRSTNCAYLESNFIFFNEKELTGLRIAPRFKVHVNNSDRTNPDLPDYRGFFGLRFTFGQSDSLIFDSHVFFAEEGHSYQADLTYPLHRLFRNNLDIYLQVQYANSLAESLINYTERTKALRIGLAIVR